jgi:hypothetical protein
VVLRFGGVNEGAAAASVNDGLKARYPPEAAEAERCWFCCSNGSGMAVTRGCISKLWISGLGVRRDDILISLFIRDMGVYDRWKSCCGLCRGGSVLCLSS